MYSYKDPKTGVDYYKDPETGETTWQKPKDYAWKEAFDEVRDAGALSPSPLPPPPPGGSLS